MCALINDVAPVTLVQHYMDDMSCSKLLGVIYRLFFAFNLLLYVLSSRERTKAPGTRKNQSQQPSAHESQATSFVRLLFVANSFSFNHRGQKNSLSTQHRQQDKHRSNTICPFPLFERLFAVILSVPVSFLELLPAAVRAMTSNGDTNAECRDFVLQKERKK